MLFQINNNIIKVNYTPQYQSENLKHFFLIFDKYSYLHSHCNFIAIHSTLIQSHVVRAAARSKAVIWPNHQVPYRFHSTISSGLRDNIITALSIIEWQTCLSFIEHDQWDYVVFTSFNSDGYFSTSFGRSRNLLDINRLSVWRTENIIWSWMWQYWHHNPRGGQCSGTMAWTEQTWSRQLHPYCIQQCWIRTVTVAIPINFQKRNSLEVDFQGTTYDYDSIMHYGQFIPTDTGSITIEVTNNAEYKLTTRATNTWSRCDSIKLYVQLPR